MNAVLDQLNTIKNTSNDVDEVLMSTKLLKLVDKIKSNDFTDAEKKIMLQHILRAHRNNIKNSSTPHSQFWKDLIARQNHTDILNNLLS